MRLFPVFPRAFAKSCLAWLALRQPKRAMAFWLVFLTVLSVSQGQQELRSQRHPLSTYLDLRPSPSGAAPQTAPSWVESFEFVPAAKTSSEVREVAAGTGIEKDQSVFRIRLLHPPNTSEHLQMRVFFDDRATGPQPRITVWNELGDKMMSKPLGQGLGLPSAETLTVSMNGVNYLEIEAPGDGSQVRGLLLGWMETAQVLQPSDFPAQDSVRQPFGVLPQAHTQREDTYLFGAVVARLHGSKPLVLKSGETPATTFAFELEHPPLLAVVTYEVLGAAIDAPPALVVNGHALGASDFYLPDLADPGFQGEAREAESQLNFRYTGWLRAQKVIPADTLAAGLNNLTVKLSNTSESVAIRSVSIQLKYNWDKLDTVLVPAPTPYETR